MDDPARFVVWIAGRRTGKTFGDVVKLITEGVEKPGSLHWYVAPTYRMAYDLAWLPLRNVLDRRYIRATNETRMEVTLANGSTIALKGADNPDSLRGRGLDGVVLDEFAFMEPGVWTEAIRPALSDKQGWAWFSTTPRGYNWAYDLWLRGVGGEEGWSSHVHTTLEGGRVPAEEIEAARRDMPPALFKQEYEASFETLAGRVYSEFSRLAWPHGNVDAGVDDTRGDLLVGLDFNVNPMSAVIAVRAADECHVLDCLEVHTSNTEEVAGEVARRYPGRSVRVYPDPSGRSRKTSAPVGVTDFTILERAGFRVVAPKAAPPVVDRINNVQANLRTADGRRRLRIHPRATALVKALDGMTYKEGTSVPDKSLGLDHLPDALGYLLWSEFSLLRDAPSVRPFRLI